MKRLLLVAVAIFCLFELSYAINREIWLSSNTQTADTFQQLCTQSTWNSRRALVHGVCINNGVPGTTYSIWGSSPGVTAAALVTSTVAVINASTTTACQYYDVIISSGLFYSNSGTANVSLLYQCY